MNVGKILIGDSDGFAPCTPAGVPRCCSSSGVKTKGAECVIVGRSNIVGQADGGADGAAARRRECTVTVCHSRTQDLASHTRRADILIVAAGKPNLVTGDMVKPGAVVIDVGINRVDDATAKNGTRLVGDVDFESANEVASMITPVPGGVGPDDDRDAAEEHGARRGAERHGMTARASLPGATAESALGVGAFLDAAKEIIEGAFQPLWMRGEVIDFKAHRNGHWYFSLKDGDATLRCMVWSPTSRIPAPPDDGDQISAYGKVNFWEAAGEFSSWLARWKRRAKDSGGGASRRRARGSRRTACSLPRASAAIPQLPRIVAVVTSPDGAALHDIVSVIQRRCPSVTIVVVAAKVQGEGAVEEIIAGDRARRPLGEGGCRDRRARRRFARRSAGVQRGSGRARARGVSDAHDLCRGP